MALHIEQVIVDLRTYLQTRIPARLAQVVSDSAAEPLGKLHLAVPRMQDYFIGEPSRFTGYRAPAVFLVPQNTTRPGAMAPGGAADWLQQEHHVALDVLIEESDEQRLSTVTYRYAEAVDAAINNQDISGAPGRAWSTLAKVTSVDYGVAFTAQRSAQRVFRKDIVLDLLIWHADLLTPMG